MASMQTSLHHADMSERLFDVVADDDGSVRYRQRVAVGEVDRRDRQQPSDKKQNESAPHRADCTLADSIKT